MSIEYECWQAIEHIHIDALFIVILFGFFLLFDSH